jgi:hypothetical protein
MINGSHVMTYGHVPIAVLDQCITAFAKGYNRGACDFAPKAL